MKFAYADPPYHQMGKKMYGPFHEQAYVWDDKESHIALVKRLENEYPDGWALSCNPRDLAWLLPAVPEDCRVAAWTKTYHQIRPTTTQFAWEPVIWRTTKKDHKRQMVRDWVSGPVSRQTVIPGSKPHYFNRWILDLLVFDPTVDTLDDLFPGTSGMALALKELKLA